MNIAVPPAWLATLSELGRFAGGRGARVWAVGGCVRDWRLGRDTADIDIVAEGDARPLAEHFAQVSGARLEFHRGFGTACASLPDGAHFDFARARSEVYTRPAALPLVSPATMEEDLKRRDFSVNAAAMSLLPESFGELLDPFRATADMEAGMLRALHDKSFEDDPTRLYRGARFAGRFGWAFESHTRALVDGAVRGKYPARLSRERLRNELLRILAEKNPAPAFRLMDELGLSDFIHPGLRWNAAAGLASTPAARLGALACVSGGTGLEFIKSLNLERTASAPLKSALKLFLSKSSPRAPLGAVEREILSAAAPKLAPAALEPLLVSGADIAGLPARNSAIAAIAAEAAAAQWRGEFADRQGALRWLSSRK
ncbi:MAG: hypothetical protein PHP45_06205 [Elusimicrobiales bacterium]|nr:hypothetical protein [Elusimicrobiales bacterium]